MIWVVSYFVWHRLTVAQAQLLAEAIATGAAAVPAANGAPASAAPNPATVTPS